MTDLPSQPEPSPQWQPPTGESARQPPARKPRGWLRWALPIVALVAGIALGAAVGASDPTDSDEYRGLEGQLAAQESEAAAAQRSGSAAAQSAQQSASAAVQSARASASSEVAAGSAAAQSAAAAASQRQSELDQREAEVAAREEAVTSTEKQIAASSVEQGTWTVGVDIEPGTYRPAQPVSSGCYWAITRTGSNGSDIIENDLPGGGLPTVQLSAGQDFTHHRCGTFVKQ